MMGMTKEQLRRLPKASLLSFRWVGRWPFDYRTRSPFFIKWRNANAYGFFLGPLMVTISAPWLEHAARALHPELFVTPPKEQAHD